MSSETLGAPPYRSAEWLRERREEGATVEEMAAECGVEPGTVRAWASRLGVSSPEDPPYRSEEWLRERYWGEGRTMGEIASEAGVARSTIVRWMDRLDVEARPRGRPAKADA